MSNLDTLYAKVAHCLSESIESRWSSEEIDGAIRLALDAVSAFCESAHTIEDLDGAEVTTFDDDELLVAGAVSYAVKNRVAKLFESGNSVKLAKALASWSQNYLDDFMVRLDHFTSGQESS